MMVFSCVQMHTQYEAKIKVLQYLLSPKSHLKSKFFPISKIVWALSGVYTSVPVP
jgi:hypothetical protein